eukprot:403334620
MRAANIDEEELQLVYQWVDSVPLSRPKKNITRDFSDAVLMAEIVHHFLPKLVEVHNYQSSSAVSQKEYNWTTLNSKVFKKIGFQLSKEDLDSIIKCETGTVERVLRFVQLQIASFLRNQQSNQANISSSYSTGYGNQGNNGGNVSFKGQSKNGKQNQNQFNIDYYEDQLQSKDKQIEELKETVEIMDLKIKKLEQLLLLKDSKIEALVNGQSQPTQPAQNVRQAQQMTSTNQSIMYNNNNQMNVHGQGGNYQIRR